MAPRERGGLFIWLLSQLALPWGVGQLSLHAPFATPFMPPPSRCAKMGNASLSGFVESAVYSSFSTNGVTGKKPLK